MAGSRIDVLYIADNGSTQYCISADESNVEMIMNGQQTPSASQPRPPQGFKPRFVIVKDVTGVISRKIPVLTPARFAAINGSTAFALESVDSDANTSVRITSKTGEKQRNAPKDYDSGRTDGD